jgi:hypothetical protein
MNKLLSIAIVIVFLASCKTKKQVASTVDCIKEEPSIIIQKIHDNALTFEQYSSKIDVKVKSSQMNQEFSASLRIQKDSAIWSAIKVFGIPVATALITTDSLKFLVKQPVRRYMIGDLNALQSRMGIAADYFTLEDLLSGRPVELSKNEQYFALCIDNNLWISTHSIQQEKELKNAPVALDETIVKYLINKENYYIERIEAERLIDKSKLVVNYETFEKIDISYVPTQTTAYFYSEKENVTLQINSSKIELNKPFEMNFEVSNKYEVVIIE